MKTFPRFVYPLTKEADGPQRPDVLKPTAWYKSEQDTIDSSSSKEREATAVVSVSSNFRDDLPWGEYAKQTFEREAMQIPGVVRVVRDHAGKSKEEQMCVIVADLFSNTTHDVIRLHERIDDAFPGLRFDVDIKDVNTTEYTLFN